MKAQSTKFYVRATATWKDSSRRKGGYFKYTDVTVDDCLISVKGDTAVIYGSPCAAGYVHSDVKRVSGQYFSFSGKEVTEATFDKHFKAKQKKAIEMKAESEARALEVREQADTARTAKRNKIKAIADSITVDAKWLEDKAFAMTLNGSEKSRVFTGAFKALLSRNGIETIDSFYEVMRLM